MALLCRDCRPHVRIGSSWQVAFQLATAGRVGGGGSSCRRLSGRAGSLSCEADRPAPHQSYPAKSAGGWCVAAPEQQRLAALTANAAEHVLQAMGLPNAAAHMSEHKHCRAEACKCSMALKQQRERARTRKLTWQAVHRGGGGSWRQLGRRWDWRRDQATPPRVLQPAEAPRRGSKRERAKC